MNNAKMWLVVKPTVGVPLFLSAVAVGSFAVHVAVLSNTSWVSDFLSGQELGSGDQAALELKQNQTAQAGYVMPGTDEVTIILSDGTPVKAILRPAEQHASAGTGTALITQ
ncbi:MAG: light-harvesting protein [Pseudomonadota bacterium]|mgnify:CR=1 FL=1